jgi:hypothetical protein
MTTVKAKARRFRIRYGAAIAFVLLAVVAIVAFNQSITNSDNKLYQSQLAACKRGNLVREESNRRIGAHQLDRDVLKQFLDSAEKARRASGKREDIKTANEYHRLSTSLNSVTFKPTPLIDCNKAVHKP